PSALPSYLAKSSAVFCPLAVNSARLRRPSPSPSTSSSCTLAVLLGLCGLSAAVSPAMALPQAKLPARTRANIGVVLFIGFPPRGGGTVAVPAICACRAEGQRQGQGEEA